MRALAIVCLLGSPAYAGRTLYGWLAATDTVPADGLEVQTSIYEHDRLGQYHERSSALLLTPAMGLTDKLELAFPIELAYITADDVAPGMSFTHYGAELRYRFLPRSSELLPVLRVGLARDATVRTEVRTELAAAVSYTRDRLQVQADAGFVVDFNIGHFHREFRPGVGASALVTGALRFGGELHVELSFDSTTQSWAVIGPNIAWARSRYWLAGGLDFGIHQIFAAPRFNLGMVW